MNVTQRVVVVGGGYAGILAALGAARRLGEAGDVTLVSASPDFVERIRLHEALASGRPVATPLALRFAGTGVRVVHGRATRIDALHRRVAIDGIPSIAYDALILAMGSVSDVDRIPGARAHASAIEPWTAGAIHARLGALAAGAWVTIAGAGLTGIEAATEAAERFPALRVRLVAPSGLGAGLSPASARHVERRLEQLGVDVQRGARIDAIEADAVITGGATLPSALTLVTAGFRAPPLARDSGLPVDDAGRVQVDASLRVRGFDAMYAAGDAAVATTAQGHVVPMGCKSALPMGAYAGVAAATELLGGSAAPLAYRAAAYCLSLGRHDGILQAMAMNDEPSWLAARGRLGAFVKERIVRYTVGALERARIAAQVRTTAPRAIPATTVRS